MVSCTKEESTLDFDNKVLSYVHADTKQPMPWFSRSTKRKTSVYELNTNLILDESEIETKVNKRLILAQENLKHNLTAKGSSEIIPYHLSHIDEMTWHTSGYLLPANPVKVDFAYEYLDPENYDDFFNILKGKPGYQFVKPTTNFGSGFSFTNKPLIDSLIIHQNLNFEILSLNTSFVQKNLKQEKEYHTKINHYFIRPIQDHKVAERSIKKVE